MATPSEIQPLAGLAWYPRSPRLSKALRSAGFITLLLICSSPFTVSVATSGTAMAPIFGAPRFGPPLGMRVLPLLMFWLIFLKMIQRKRAGRWTTLLGRAAFASIAAILIAGVFHATGWGGGTTVTALPVIPTPQGSSTLTVTPSAISLSGKPLQLQPIQLTLTVNQFAGKGF